MNLLDWIDKEDESEELLPLCHTTRWKHFENILEKGILSKEFSRFPDPNPYNSNLEKLIYLFYGLPFYIYETGSDGEINSEVTEDLPSGLIFKPSMTDAVDRFYPFDTGALLSGSYKNVFDVSEDELKTYEAIISNGKEIKKFVRRYYKNNEKYCFGNLNDSIDPLSPKEENLLRLFKFSSKSGTDIRSRAMEVHSLNDIKLEHKLSAVVLPRLRSNRYKYLVDDIQKQYPAVKIEYYNDLIRYNSQSIRDAVLNKTMDMYDNDSLMSFSYANL